MQIIPIMRKTITFSLFRLVLLGKSIVIKQETKCTDIYKSLELAQMITKLVI